MSHRICMLITAACFGIVAGLIASEAPIYGAPATKKECGTGGASNNNCNKFGTPVKIGPTTFGCIGNCLLAPAGYKTCTGTPGTCKDDKETQCNGILMDGDTDGKGCDGKPVLDDSGRGHPQTCQNNKFKYCT